MKGIISIFLNATERIANTRIARILLSCVFVAIFLLGILSAVNACIVGYGTVKNTKLLAQESEKIEVQELSPDGIVKLKNGESVDAIEIYNTYPISRMSKMYYISNLGLFLPVELDSVYEYTIGYVYLLSLFLLVCIIVNPNAKIFAKDYTRYIVMAIYFVIMLLEHLGYYWIINSYAENKDILLGLVLLQYLLEIVRVGIILFMDSHSVSRKGVKKAN